MSKKPDKARLTLEIPVETRKLMNELQQRTGAASVAEVIRRALDAYDVLTCELGLKGHSIIGVRKPNGTMREVTLII